MTLSLCLNGRSNLNVSTKKFSGDFSNECEAIPQRDPCPNRDHVLPRHHSFSGSDLVPKQEFVLLQPHVLLQSQSRRSAYSYSKTFAETDMQGGLGCDSDLAKDEQGHPFLQISQQSLVME
jgi:hypothetical protein